MGHSGITTDFDIAEYSVLKLAEQCMELSHEERPEVTWLKKLYEEQRRQLSLSKSQMDDLLYLRITGHPPLKPDDTLKIRYWRTGHHVPVNRKVCTLFGRALGLTGTQQQYLLQGYLDKSLLLYDEIPSEADTDYWKRRAALNALIASYLGKKSATKAGMTKSASQISSSSFRHLYYTDALRCIHQPEHFPGAYDKHIYSVRYDMELRRNLKLLGEIPRKTMIRHLLILGLPSLSTDWMNQQLAAFGYLPLSAEHTMTGGEHLDRLLIGLLDNYEKLREQQIPRFANHPYVKENSTHDAERWFCRCCQKLDAMFISNHKNGFRFMYFKSLE